MTSYKYVFYAVKKWKLKIFAVNRSANDRENI